MRYGESPKQKLPNTTLQSNNFPWWSQVPTHLGLNFWNCGLGPPCTNSYSTSPPFGLFRQGGGLTLWPNHPNQIWKQVWALKPWPRMPFWVLNESYCLVSHRFDSSSFKSLGRELKMYTGWPLIYIELTHFLEYGKPCPLKKLQLRFKNYF